MFLNHCGRSSLKSDSRVCVCCGRVSAEGRRQENMITPPIQDELRVSHWNSDILEQLLETFG